MNRILCTAVILVAFPFVAFAQHGKKDKKNDAPPPQIAQVAVVEKTLPCDLKVRIKGLTGGKCELGNHYGDKQFIQDSANVDATGNFEFKDTVLKPGGIYLIVLPSKKYFEIVLTDDQDFSIETDTTDLIANMKISGSTENQYFYEYLNYMSDEQKKMENFQSQAKNTKNKDSIAMFQKKIADIDNDVKNYKRVYYKTKHPETFMAEVLSAMDEPDAIPYSQCPKKPDGSIDSTYNYWNFRNHYWDGVNFSDDRLVRTPVYANKMKFYLDKMIPQSPDSIEKGCDWLIEKARPSKELFKYTVYYCTYNYETSKVMGYDAIFCHIVEKYYVTNQVWWVTDEQKKKIIDRAHQLEYSLIGQNAYNITFEDTSGMVRPLDAVKAKYTVLIYWDPTCSHCQKEIPALKTYYDSLRKTGVSIQVYAIYSELDYKGWKHYIKEHKLNWVNVAAKTPEDLSASKYYYDVYSTPTVYLLDQNKVIFGKRLDVDGLKGFLNHTINEDKKKAAANSPVKKSSPTTTKKATTPVAKKPE